MQIRCHDVSKRWDFSAMCPIWRLFESVPSASVHYTGLLPAMNQVIAWRPPSHLYSQVVASPTTGMGSHSSREQCILRLANRANLVAQSRGIEIPLLFTLQLHSRSHGKSLLAFICPCLNAIDSNSASNSAAWYIERLKLISQAIFLWRDEYNAGASTAINRGRPLSWHCLHFSHIHQSAGGSRHASPLDQMRCGTSTHPLSTLCFVNLFIKETNHHIPLLRSCALRRHRECGKSSYYVEQSDRGRSGTFYETVWNFFLKGLIVGEYVGFI